MRSLIRPVRVYACVRVSCLPSDLTLCVILVMKLLGVITLAGSVPRVGSHKTHLDNQNDYTTCWLF